MSVYMLPLALVIICIAMSTREDRAAAREWLKPYTRRLLPFVAIMWAWIIWAVAWPSPR